MSATAERGVNALREQIDAPVASFFSSCVSCGLCADACLFFQETQDPQYTPIRKVELMRRVWENDYTLFGRLKSLVGLGHKVTEEDFTEWERLVYDSCTMCGRCIILSSMRNRPDHLRDDNEPVAYTSMSDLAKASGLKNMPLTEPHEVAETCLAGIRAGKFWILPASEANDAQLRKRTENILARANPALPG